MFNVLYVEDDAERDEGEDRGPEAEVACPDVLVVINLERCLDGRSGDEGADCRLSGVNC